MLILVGRPERSPSFDMCVFVGVVWHLMSPFDHGGHIPVSSFKRCVFFVMQHAGRPDGLRQISDVRQHPSTTFCASRSVEGNALEVAFEGLDQVVEYTLFDSLKASELGISLDESVESQASIHLSKAVIVITD